MSKPVGVHCYIGGKVQGVWFRASTKDEADKLGITGWVRNLPDGRVEVSAYGDEASIAKFLDWLKNGPRMAEVASFQSEVTPWQEHISFDVR